MFILVKYWPINLKRILVLTRPYTRAEVACRWAGAAEKLSVTDGPTDRQTDRQADRVGHRVACTRLKMRLSLTRHAPLVARRARVHNDILKITMN